MAIIMKMQWAGVTPAQYVALRDAVGWETELPDGGIAHLAWFQDDGVHIVDAWESAEHFQAFADERLPAGVAKVGIAGEPVVEVLPAHRIFDAVHGTARS